MANTPEVPRAFHDAFEPTQFPFPRRSLLERLRRIPEATPAQIAVFNQAHRYLLPHEEALKSWAVSAIPEATRNKIAANRGDSLERFDALTGNPGSPRVSVVVLATPDLDFKVIGIADNDIVFDKMGHIIKIVLKSIPVTLTIAAHTQINIRNPRELAVFDSAENQKYPVLPNGLCMYGSRRGEPNSDPERFLRALQTFTKEALSPILKP